MGRAFPGSRQTPQTGTRRMWGLPHESLLNKQMNKWSILHDHTRHLRDSCRLHRRLFPHRGTSSIRSFPPLVRSLLTHDTKSVVVLDGLPFVASPYDTTRRRCPCHQSPQKGFSSITSSLDFFYPFTCKVHRPRRARFGDTTPARPVCTSPVSFPGRLTGYILPQSPGTPPTTQREILPPFLTSQTCSRDVRPKTKFPSDVDDPDPTPTPTPRRFLVDPL